MNAHPRRLLLALAACATCTLLADPLSKKTDIDFYRDVLSRDLHGLATRSDGRLVAGPVMTDLTGKAPSELLWCLEPASGGAWIAGGGPGGRILEVTADLGAGTYATKELAALGNAQVFALKALPDGSILAGTFPGAEVVLLRAGKVAARASLPAEAVYDLLLSADAKSVLAATGNPGRIYRIDLALFASSGAGPAKAGDSAALEARGIRLFGEVGDKNVRRIARLADGSVVAGSAPKGSLYLFPSEGGAPFIVQENRDAEVTDLLADPKGGYFATIVFSGGEIHPVQSQQPAQPEAVTPAPDINAAPGANPTPTPAPASKPKPSTPEILTAPPQVENFPGRSTLQWFGTDGFPETLATRQGVAFYRMCRYGDLVVLSGGEKGEMTGYDTVTRTSLTFAGSASSQVNVIEPVPGSPGRFLALRNNAVGFSVLDFTAAGPRTASTKRIDLGAPARLGALRFDREREVDDSLLSLSIRTTNAANETDGWSPWTAMAESDGWRASVPTGRYVELKLSVAAAAKPTLQLDRASLYFLTQNHRPQLTEFRVLSPNFAIVVPPETPSPVTTTVGQLLQSGDRDGERRRGAFLGSQVYSSPGTRVIFWTVTDPDGDNLLYTFSIRHEGDDAWTDLAVDAKESYVQFDTLHLKEGTWFTRLVARETAPRPAAERLSVAFETDDMVVDHTPPEIDEATAKREDGRIIVTVRGHDALSLLDSAEFTFNNGAHEVVEQPADGILDGRRETFVLEISAARAAGATSVEVTLSDAAGNSSTRRLSL